MIAGNLFVLMVPTFPIFFFRILWGYDCGSTDKLKINTQLVSYYKQRRFTRRNTFVFRPNLGSKHAATSIN